MVRHLGFIIPFLVTLRQGARDSYPGPGICAECGRPSARNYIRHDDAAYCETCIAKDLASVLVGPDDAQRHPDLHPAEMIYDVMKVKGGVDDFELRSVSAGPHPDPRIFDRALA